VHWQQENIAHRNEAIKALYPDTNNAISRPSRALNQADYVNKETMIQG